MRKLAALITLSTLAGLGAALTTAGAAGAEEPPAASSSAGAGVLFEQMHDQTHDVEARLDARAGQGPTASVGDTLDTAMTMNHLAQLADMSTSVMSASNTSVAAMARGVKS